MKAKSLKLGVEDHQAMGTELKRIQAYVSEFMIEVANAYGKSSKAMKLAGKVNDALSDFRSELEERFFEDYPDIARPEVYYGHDKE